MKQCNCIKETAKKLQENGYEVNDMPDNVNILSGRQFATWDFKEKKRGRKALFIEYSFCPHCGKPYNK